MDTCLHGGGRSHPKIFHKQRECIDQWLHIVARQVQNTHRSVKARAIERKNEKSQKEGQGKCCEGWLIKRL